MITLNSNRTSISRRDFLAAAGAAAVTVPGRPDSSAMDWFARRGFNTWTVDMEGYGRSDKDRDSKFYIADGADDLAAASDYIMKTRGVRRLLVYGISSGGLRAAMFAQRHPDRIARLAVDAFVWTGEGSPTLAERRKRLPEYRKTNRRPGPTRRSCRKNGQEEGQGEEMKRPTTAAGDLPRFISMKP